MSLYEDFRHLPPAAAMLARASARPQQVALVGVCVLTALGAAILGVLMSENAAENSSIWRALCGTNAIEPNLTAFGLSLATWLAMILVMMIPGAAPMLLTYAEIADTAAARGAMAPSPLVLAGGYLAVWVAFGFLASGIETGLSQIPPGSEAATILLSGNLILSGLFQFSTLKHACLARCRRPFAFFFANWTDRRAGVFRLGLRQGVYCLGCCWALMLLMLALGTMNLIWMAGLAAIMAAEKMTHGKMLPRLIGITLIAAGAILLAINVHG